MNKFHRFHIDEKYFFMKDTLFIIFSCIGLLIAWIIGVTLLFSPVFAFFYCFYKIAELLVRN